MIVTSDVQDYLSTCNAVVLTLQHNSAVLSE